ncbi:MAG: HAD family hydrolase, partial [Candidatus Margulisiibacteriota bacterium]
MNKAVFLDRDGTLIEDVGYLSDEKDIRLLIGAAEAVSSLGKAGFKTVMITNQAAIARGIISESRFGEINAKVLSQFLSHGAGFDGVYYCPHHPTEGKGKYLAKCSCRKPFPGMILKAAKELGLDLSRSFMIGDRYKDIEAGINAGCKTVLVPTAGVKNAEEKSSARPDHLAKNILEAAEWVIAD